MFALNPPGIGIGDTLPAPEDVEARPVGDKESREGVTLVRLLLSRKGQREAVPALLLRGSDFDGTVLVSVPLLEPVRTTTEASA